MNTLTAEEVGECRLAIRAVALEGKPIVEVSARPAVEAELRKDLEECRRNSGHGDAVLCWIRPLTDDAAMLSYGFYREAWTIAAFDWWRAADLAPVDRHWIGGLLFGYTPAAIQAFIDKECGDKDD